jgi:hypothetical protein
MQESTPSSLHPGTTPTQSSAQRDEKHRDEKEVRKMAG